MNVDTEVINLLWSQIE